ncbi:MAG TPA: AI-2E family transporter [Thermotoga sp.]|nr:AI-2E family transporter [Thermotoga sp. RQ2]HBF69963.1 AI-2E family transporter [Thermotoga sp.]
MKNLKNKHFALLYLVLFLVLAKLSPFIITALIMGLYLSIIIDYVARFLGILVKKPRVLPRVISNVLVFLTTAYSAVNFFPVIVREAQKVFTEIDRIKSGLENIDIPGWLSSILNSISASFSEGALSLVNKIIGYVPSFITAAILIVITAFIVSSLKRLIKENVHYLFPTNPSDGKEFLKTTYTEFERFVGGQVLVAIFVGLFVGFGAFIFKIPSAFFLGMLAFVTDFVPYLGVVISAIPLLMLAFSVHGLSGLLIGTIILVAANQLEMWVLAPKIQSNTLNVHWFIILITILILGDLFSFGGVLIALPFLIFLKNFWKQYVMGG